MSEQHFQEQQKKKTSCNFLLGTGIAFVLLGGCLLGVLSADFDLRSISILHLMCAALGGILLFLSIVKVRRKSVMFAGLFLTMTGPSPPMRFFPEFVTIPWKMTALPRLFRVNVLLF